jgi:hypothetical protein
MATSSVVTDEPRKLQMTDLTPESARRICAVFGVLLNGRPMTPNPADDATVVNECWQWITTLAIQFPHVFAAAGVIVDQTNTPALVSISPEVAVQQSAVAAQQMAHTMAVLQTQQAVQQVRVELSNVRASEATLARKNAQLERQVKELQDNLARISATLDAKTMQLSDSQKLHDELSAENEQFRKEIANMSAENEQFRKKIADMKKEIGELKEKVLRHDVLERKVAKLEADRDSTAANFLVRDAATKMERYLLFYIGVNTGVGNKERFRHVGDFLNALEDDDTRAELTQLYNHKLGVPAMKALRAVLEATKESANAYAHPNVRTSDTVFDDTLDSLVSEFYNPKYSSQIKSILEAHKDEIAKIMLR